MQVSRPQAVGFARRHKLPYAETSARTGDGVHEAFYAAVEATARRIATEQARLAAVGEGGPSLVTAPRATAAAPVYRVPAEKRGFKLSTPRLLSRMRCAS